MILLNEATRRYHWYIFRTKGNANRTVPTT